MIKQIFKHAFIALALSLNFNSCTKDIDFDQADDLEISPVLESSLIFFDEPANKFLNGSEEITNIEDFVTVEFFNGEFIVENLTRADFVLETTNSINRNFEVQVDFFDELEQLQHTFTFSGIASPSNSDIISEHIEVFENDKLTALKQTVKLVFTLRMLQGNAINQNTPGRISLKSKAIFYFNILG